jgi:hypothetical protein
MNLSPAGPEPSGVHAETQPHVEEMIAMPKRFGTLAAAALAVAAATMAWAAPAQADTPGFAVKITSAPDTFTVGEDARTVSAVVSTDRPDLRRCLKVRWALVVSTQGVSLDQIKVNRVENGQSVPVRADLQEDSARVVDAQLDPGQLCRNQTVTAKWTVSFTGPDNGSVTLAARALSQQGRLLASADVSSRVVTAVANKPSTSPSTSASPSPSSTFTPEPTKAAVVAPLESSSVDPAALAKNTSGLNVLLPGLIVGAVLVFVGIALLLRLRSRNRRNGPAGWHQDTQMLPTGFYNMPRRGSE